MNCKNVLCNLYKKVEYIFHNSNLKKNNIKGFTKYWHSFLIKTNKNQILFRIPQKL